MASNTLICPNCKKNIELSEALLHEFQEEFELKHKKDMEEAVRIASENVKKEFELKQSEELDKLKKENAKKDEELRKKELEALEEKKKLEEEKELFEKNKAKEEERLRDSIYREMSDKTRLEKLEYEKKISDMQKALEEAQRKGKQGSQQLQGEVLELDLEDQLKSQFPMDDFMPIPKGVEGADIWQKVKDMQGKEVGSIIWETKRTKNWDKKWLTKLKDDARRVNASECILVSQVLPNDIKSFHRLEGVWISNYEYALHVVRTVRYLMLKVAVIKDSVSHEDEELRQIYDYIISDAFRHKIEAHNEAIRAMEEDLSSEQRLTQIRWKKRAFQIKKLDNSVSQLYGELQGIMPKLQDIDIEKLESGESEI